MEIWKKIPVLDGSYEASNTGIIRSTDKTVTKLSGFCGKIVEQKYKGRILKGTKGKWGHIFIRLGYKKKVEAHQAGRLILMAFVGLPEKGMECCHNNGDPADNRIENLRWDTHYENNQDRKKHGTYALGENHHFCKFSDDFIRKIKSKEINKKEAMEAGISNTHYYRILRGGSRTQSQ